MSVATLGDLIWFARGETSLGYRDVDGATIASATQPGQPTLGGLTQPSGTLDAWVVGKVRHVLLGDHDAVDAAVGAFVRAVRLQVGRDGDGGALAEVERELVAINRRIKSVVAMIADPTFDGLDELKQTLADLKARRDALDSRLADARGGTATPFSEAQLREWATDRFGRLDELCAARSATPEMRSLIHAYVHRIEIDPHARRGTLYLPADAFACLQRDLSTRATLEDSSAAGAGPRARAADQARRAGARSASARYTPEV